MYKTKKCSKCETMVETKNWEEISKQLNCYICKKEWATKIIYIKEANELRFVCEKCAKKLWPKILETYNEASTCSMILVGRQWIVDTRGSEVNKNELFPSLVPQKWKYFVTSYNAKKYGLKYHNGELES